MVKKVRVGLISKIRLIIITLCSLDVTKLLLHHRKPPSSLTKSKATQLIRYIPSVSRIFSWIELVDYLPANIQSRQLQSLPQCNITDSMNKHAWDSWSYVLWLHLKESLSDRHFPPVYSVRNPIAFQDIVMGEDHSTLCNSLDILIRKYEAYNR